MLYRKADGGSLHQQSKFICSWADLTMNNWWPTLSEFEAAIWNSHMFHNKGHNQTLNLQSLLYKVSGLWYMCRLMDKHKEKLLAFTFQSSQRSLANSEVRWATLQSCIFAKQTAFWLKKGSFPKWFSKQLLFLSYPHPKIHCLLQRILFSGSFLPRSATAQPRRCFSEFTASPWALIAIAAEELLRSA